MSEFDAVLQDPASRAAYLAQFHRSLWVNGLLEYLFHATQTKIHDLLNATLARRFMLLCSRRLGKSFMLLALAFKTAIRTPKARVLFLAPSAKHASEIATDLADQLLQHCPNDLRPEYKSLTKEFVFPNGSIVRLKGTNGEHASDLRGGSANLVIIDEAGLVDNLRSVVNDVCLPMTLTTKGRIVLATTPAESPGHDSAQIYEALAAEGNTASFTIRDAPHIADEEKCELLIAMGEAPGDVAEILAGTKQPRTTAARRELFCEWVTDANRAVLPEWQNKRLELTRAPARPEYFDAYVACDPGFSDNTGLLFGYWDWLAGKFVVEDEALLKQANTGQIIECIRAKEAALWPGQIPYMRVSDTDKRLIADLSQLHGLSFHAARKEDSLGAINLLRNDIQNDRILVNPRCVHLIRQMSNCTWDRSATDFARSAADGHYDLVAALKYVVRMVNRTRNPYPDWYRLRGGPHGPGFNDWVSPKRQKQRGLGLYSDTPLGRKLAKTKPPRR